MSDSLALSGAPPTTQPRSPRPTPPTLSFTPTASGGAALLARLNAAPDAPAVHASLCLAYLGATVAEAHVFCVDRTGFGLLGRDASPGAEWREFRFAFSNEVRDVAGLESTLRDMADEARAHVAAGSSGAAA
jgi:hypothetical protein